MESCLASLRQCDHAAAPAGPSSLLKTAHAHPRPLPPPLSSLTRHRFVPRARRLRRAASDRHRCARCRRGPAGRLRTQRDPRQVLLHRSGPARTAAAALRDVASEGARRRTRGCCASRPASASPRRFARLRRRHDVLWAVPDYRAHAAGELDPQRPGHRQGAGRLAAAAVELRRPVRRERPRSLGKRRRRRRPRRERA